MVRVLFLFLLSALSRGSFAHAQSSEIHISPPTLEAIRDAVFVNDHKRVEFLSSRYLYAQPRGKHAEKIWYLLGIQYRNQKKHDLSSQAMTRVRRFWGPFRESATYYEAEQDQLRGRAAVAIKECVRYATDYPEGRYLSACVRTTALAYADLGKVKEARETALAYDEENPNPISELVDLHLALALKENHPKRAVKFAKKLYTTHTSVNIGQRVEQLLQEWGVPLPNSPRDQVARVMSLRDSGQREKSIALFDTLSKNAHGDDLSLRASLSSISGLTGWRNRDWPRLVEKYQKQYKEKPTSKDAWSLYRVYFRAGAYSQATAWATDALRRHAGTRKWRRKEDELAHTMMMHGAYGRAINNFDIVAERGGTRGRDAAFFAAFSAHQMGDLNAANARLTAIIESPKGAHEAARYWRAKTLHAIGDVQQATNDELWLLTHSPHSWYSQLLRKPSDTDLLRNGRWIDTNAPLPRSPTPLFSLMNGDLASTIPDYTSTRSKPSHSSLQLPWSNTVTGRSTTTTTPPWLQLQYKSQPYLPIQYRDHVLFNREKLRTQVVKLMRKHGKTWPEIAEILALSDVGLTDESGARMAAFWKDYKEALKSRKDARHAEAKKLYQQDDQVRALMLLAHDNHNLAKQWYNVPQKTENEPNKQFSKMVANPLAHAQTVWPTSIEHDIDPMLITALMRRESLFNPLAVSKVGARGAMQIMPRTGGLLAQHRNDIDFTTSDLENPTIAIPYAASYLALLLERFEGVYPLAVAAYNAGPHNVGNWLNAADESMKIDAFVEHIPYKETRRYVKGVTSSYATIASIYGETHKSINIPVDLPTDHPSVVTF